MTQETLHKILDIQEAVMQDEEYVKLHEEYIPAQERFAAFWMELPWEERQIVDDYLLASVQLYHRILEIGVIQK